MLLRTLLLLWFVGVLLSQSLFAQADNCSAATLLSIDATCSSPVSGTTIGATETIPGCTGIADDDVWYRFVATATSHSITITPSAGMDAVAQLFSGGCSTLVSLGCRDNAGIGGIEIINASNLVIGQTYRIRVYHRGIGSGSGTFTICVANTASAPSNDNCSSATNLNVNNSCVSTSGTLIGAQPSFPGCAGTASDDVWYTFTATNAVQTVTVTPTNNVDLVMAIYSGTCSALTSIVCSDIAGTNGVETQQLVGLTVGSVYRIRVYDYYGGGTGTFNICVVGQPTPAPSNDEPCNAISIPAVNATCNYLEFTNVGATSSVGPPTPASCAGGSGAMNGGYSGSTSDVWFAITVPASGNIAITQKPSSGAGWISDGVMALYIGTCSSLTQIACADDYNYPGASNDLKPMINATGLTPGSTVYLRVWGYGSATGKFGFCVTTATNDNCANALYICDLNGYSASTSSSYTPDRPCNMRGNAETNNPPTYTYTPGTNQGGIFGSAGSWGTGSPAFDVQINNNSWIRFTAAATTATLTVNVYDCFVGNYPSGGIQMQVFASNGACCNFVPVSNFEESSTQFVITATNLTIGNDYYLMVDGYAGDICNYTITADSGVQFPEIPAVPPICLGQSTTLTAPSGADSYYWPHNGSTSQSVTVTPGTTQTFTCEVTGLCNYRQTLSVQVQVKPSPILELNYTSSPSICSGDPITLTATGADSYSWSNGQSGASITISPTSSTTYTVTGVIGGCSATKSLLVTVKPKPTVAITPSTVQPTCAGDPVTLTANGATSYSWNTGATTASLNVNPTSTTTYTVTGTTNGCTDSETITVTVKPKPTVTITPSTNSAICAGNPITLTGGGATSYSWNTSATSTAITVSPITNTTYTVTGTTNGCSTTTSHNVIVNQVPNINGSATATPSDCGASTGTISGLSSPTATSYSWANTSGTQVSSTINASNLPAGNYTLTVTDANGCNKQYGPVTITNPNAPGAPSVSVDDDTPCEFATVNLTASNVSGANYQWSGPNGFNQTGQSASITNYTASNNGNYCLVITVAGCESQPNCVAVNLQAPPTIAINGSSTELIVCEGGNAQLNVTGGTSYQWTGPNSFQATGASVQIVPFGANNEGYYFVNGTDVNGCTNKDSIYVNMVSNPTINITTDGTNAIYCNETGATLTANGGANYQWAGPNGFTANGASITIPSVTTQSAGWYHVVVEDTNQCQSIDSVQIKLSFAAGAINALSDSIFCPGESIPFSASGATNYSWSGPQGHISNQANFVLVNAQPENTGWYVVEATDSIGCMIKDSVFISIEPKAACLIIPDLFTPDLDLLNDTWHIPGLQNFHNVEVKIFNRWGNLIYTEQPYHNDWDGKVNHGATIGSGNKVPPGTYFYILQLNDPENTPAFKGYVEIQY